METSLSIHENYFEIANAITMDLIKIDATDDTPKVVCNSDGTISIIGKSLPEDSISFYKPVHDWITQIYTENLVISLRLDYMNTSSSKQIYTLLELAKKNQLKKNLKIKWYYNVNDDESYELGKEFETMLELPFEFYYYEV